MCIRDSCFVILHPLSFSLPTITSFCSIASFDIHPPIVTDAGRCSLSGRWVLSMKCPSCASCTPCRGLMTALAMAAVHSTLQAFACFLWFDYCPDYKCNYHYENCNYNDISQHVIISYSLQMLLNILLHYFFSLKNPIIIFTASPSRHRRTMTAMRSAVLNSRLILI